MEQSAPQENRIAVGIGQYLDFDMAGMIQIFSYRAYRCRRWPGLRHGQGDGVQQGGSPCTTACHARRTAGRLMITGNRSGPPAPGCRRLIPRGHRNRARRAPAAASTEWLKSYLHQPDGLGPRADEDKASAPPLGEIGVFRQKAVAWMDGRRRSLRRR